ncbi:MAG: tRNA-dihydrouridine synthase family protein [Oscillospiraceae bacterium]|nr:tRNA-dihydrouridine synthase family protein [Oscillospiraceae bacterium]
MNIYFAPLEGLTDSTYRRLHHKYFPGVDCYYTPFFSPTSGRRLTPREIRELPPADSLDVPVIPQLLTKNPEDFLWMCEKFQDLGYTEINLNTGCPSGTVTAKGKGAGMLREPESLARFLDGIFEKASVQISVKTRLGFENPEEFSKILEIFNRYPIQELTIHPRVRNAFYKGAVDKGAFAYALSNSKMPLCYNGNLNTLADIKAISEEYPTLNAVMLGRGLIGDPGMCTPDGTKRDTLEAFFAELLEEYLIVFGGSRNAMFRLKEHWRYLLCKFEGSEKLGKRLRKTTDLEEYRQITKEIFRNLPMRAEVDTDW